MNISTKNLLLLDGIGALVTATLLSQVLAPWQSVFGMPKDILYPLAGIALCFAAFSFSGYFLARQKGNHFLKIIAVSNSIYCFATAVLVVLHLDKLSWLGVSYFIGEIIVVFILVYAEFAQVRKSRLLASSGQ